MSLSRRVSTVLIIVLLVTGALLVASCSAGEDAGTAPPPTGGSGAGSGADPGPAPAAPDAPKALVDLKCSMCHPLDQVYAAQYDRAGWESTVERMKRNGLVLTDEEYAAIIDYLAQQ